MTGQDVGEGADRGVSSVISVILMVAVTVILAAVVATFALDLGGSASDTGPQASFQFEYDTTTGNVTVAHTNGDALDGDRLRFSGAAVDKRTFGSITEWAGSEVTGGETAQVHVEEGEELRVAWRSEDRSQSAVLGEFTVPEAGVVASGSVSVTDLDGASGEVTVDVGSLSAVGGNANLVAENTDTGNSVSRTVSGAGSYTLSPGVGPGDTVEVTLYESGTTNQLDRESATAPDAGVTFGVAPTSGDVEFTLKSISNTGSVTVVVSDSDGNSASDEFSNTGTHSVSLGSGVVDDGERIEVVVYDSSVTNFELARTSNGK
jgi:flagellin-like protein